MKLFFIAITLLLSFSTQAQVLKSRTIMLSIKNGTDTSDNWKMNNTLIVYDVAQKRLKLFDPNSSPDKTFDLVKLIDQETLKNDPNILASTETMIDQDGTKIKGVIFSNKKGITGLTLWYEQVTYVYYAQPLD
jgi:hypothetical protein